jgi:glycosyltransferase involved in cell wall biosynthesis
VDTNRFSPRYRSEEWRRLLSGGHPEAPILLYVGGLAKQGRVAWLRPMMDVLVYAHLVIVGEGPIQDELEQVFAGTSTVFTGRLEGEGLARTYASVDLFVTPSMSEAVGTYVLEAMASGLPVIAPRAGAPLAHVIDGENGFLFEPGEPREMVALARWLVADPAHTRRLGASARTYAETRSWAEVREGFSDNTSAALAGDQVHVDDWLRAELDFEVQIPESHPLHLFA